ncbi:hypothetical protein [Microscilla marina]|uniref:Uncharacterized protein n=1 Tax=Microscilla marina ATCC 23134 TaxID=313606 RepID=A1ZY13_MICM2|nr:hypothetical protein [Microscilla marina]EAY24750.1 hypothetical protein M23134_05552 [Microscilla marina ATCC 23134]
MKEFDNIEQIFGWFIENVYPTLTSEEKRKMKDAKYEFQKRGNISKKKMQAILDQYGEIKMIYHIKKQS